MASRTSIVGARLFPSNRRRARPASVGAAFPSPPVVRLPSFGQPGYVFQDARGLLGVDPDSVRAATRST